MDTHGSKLFVIRVDLCPFVVNDEADRGERLRIPPRVPHDANLEAVAGADQAEVC